MKRREFITLLGGAVAAWPLTARAQRPNLPKRLGILMPLAESEAEPQAWISALLENLQKLGWKKNENLAIDIRWGGGDAVRLPMLAAELAAWQPDVLVGNGTVALGALKQAAPSTPIIFVNVIDPVSSGMVTSLAAPGGNMTGFTNLQTSMAGKWLELLQQLKPAIVRALVIANLDNPAMASLVDELNHVGSALSIAVITGGVRTRLRSMRRFTNLAAGSRMERSSCCRMYSLPPTTLKSSPCRRVTISPPSTRSVSLP
jgi:putative ABC transport system substrate-binding protein